MSGEVLAHTVLLFDATGKKLPGGYIAIYPGPGGFTGNRADVTVTSAGARVTTDEGGVDSPVLFNSSGRERVTFLCNAACNPSRDFVLVVASASDNMTRTGFVFDVPNGTLTGSRTGTNAHVLTGRMFDGSIVHASAVADVGASIAQASHTASISNRLIGLFDGPGGNTLLAAETPTGRLECSCAWTKGAAGQYAFLIDDADPAASEVYLAYSDVQFP